MIRDVSELRDGQSLVLQRNKIISDRPADLRKRDIKTLIKVSHPTLNATNAQTSRIFDYLASQAQKEEELVNDNDPLNLNLLRKDAPHKSISLHQGDQPSILVTGPPPSNKQERKRSLADIMAKIHTFNAG